MDVQKKLDEIAAALDGARSLPMSASCVVNRAELLALVEGARAALPGSLDRARELIGERERLVDGARAEARRIVEDARAERAALLSGTGIAREADAEAGRILAEAHRAAAEIRTDADRYVDSKLANFEVVLTKAIGSVAVGRERLPGPYPEPYAAPEVPGPRAPAPPQAPEAPEPAVPDPVVVAERADASARATLDAFETVLTRTLDAVGRGRRTLYARTGDDPAGFPDALDVPERATSDAEYLAGLAEPPGRPFPAGPATGG
ncbi:hypothetical protein AB0G74_06550 [Streptomyces sp. NPDC020875]|uniref:hypothetical protein n=1 Tax=Streptomyces sp. NPDC020875 TaxID=3154898 RepID=UPI0033D3475E